MELLSIFKSWYLKVKLCIPVIFKALNHGISEEESKLYMALRMSKTSKELGLQQHFRIYRKHVWSVHALGPTHKQKLYEQKSEDTNQLLKITEQFKSAPLETILITNIFTALPSI